jgi:hypothetical protein
MSAESVCAYNRKRAAERCQERQGYHKHTPSWVHGGFATQHIVAAVELAGGGGGTS